MMWVYLYISKKFIRVGNYFWHLHVEEIRKKRRVK
tara:strand:- start:564 stop:668 length:105 start_codon:yes stop_codon:yes gene_type:complete